MEKIAPTPATDKPGKAVAKKKDQPMVAKGKNTVTGEPKNVIDTDPALAVDERGNGLGEGLSVIQRLKRRQTMRKYANKITVTRDRALARRANMKVLRRRARKSAIDTLKTKLAGGRDVHGMSSSEKSRLEDMLKKRKQVVARLTDKMIKHERKLENQRLSNEFVPGFTEEFDVAEAGELADLMLVDISHGINEDTLLVKAREYGIDFKDLRTIYETAILNGDEYASAFINSYIVRETREEGLNEGAHTISACYDHEGAKVTKKFSAAADNVSKAINKVGLHLSKMGAKVHELKKA